METTDSHGQEPAGAMGKSEVWKRGLIMLVFMFAFGVGQGILYLSAVAQFLWLLFERNRTNCWWTSGNLWLFGLPTLRGSCPAPQTRSLFHGQLGQRLIEAEADHRPTRIGRRSMHTGMGLIHSNKLNR